MVTLGKFSVACGMVYQTTSILPQLPSNGLQVRRAQEPFPSNHGLAHANDCPLGYIPITASAL